jgi:hypothetical protein
MARALSDRAGDAVVRRQDGGVDGALAGQQADAVEALQDLDVAQRLVAAAAGVDLAGAAAPARRDVLELGAAAVDDDLGLVEAEIDRAERHVGAVALAAVALDARHVDVQEVDLVVGHARRIGHLEDPLGQLLGPARPVARGDRGQRKLAVDGVDHAVGVLGPPDLGHRAGAKERQLARPVLDVQARVAEHDELGVVLVHRQVEQRRGMAIDAEQPRGGVVQPGAAVGVARPLLVEHAELHPARRRIGGHRAERRRGGLGGVLAGVVVDLAARRLPGRADAERRGAVGIQDLGDVMPRRIVPRALGLAGLVVAEQAVEGLVHHAPPGAREAGGSAF